MSESMSDDILMSESTSGDIFMSESTSGDIVNQRGFTIVNNKVQFIAPQREYVC